MLSRYLGDGHVSFSTKKRQSDVAELIGGNLGAKLHSRRRLAPGSADRPNRSADRPNRSADRNPREGRHVPPQQEESIRMVSYGIV